MDAALTSLDQMLSPGLSKKETLGSFSLPARMASGNYTAMAVKFKLGEDAEILSLKQAHASCWQIANGVDCQKMTST